jgi:hypothetical protein
MKRALQFMALISLSIGFGLPKDLRADPIEIHSTPESLDDATRDYWEQRLNDLHGCQRTGCQAAENAPLFPPPASSQADGTR